MQQEKQARYRRKGLGWYPQRERCGAVDPCRDQRVSGLMAEVEVGLVGDEVGENLEDMAISFHSVEAELVLALGAVFWPGSTHGCGVVPDDRGAEGGPAGGTDVGSEEDEVINVAKYVEVGLGLGKAERFPCEDFHKGGPSIE